MALSQYKTPILPSLSDKIKHLLLHTYRPDHSSPIPIPPHRVSLDTPISQRIIQERNFATQTTTRIQPSWSWEKTERYVYNKDLVMLGYLFDFPIQDWASGKETARHAFEAFWAREEMRGMGVSIYEMGTQFSWWMTGDVADIPIIDEETITDDIPAVEEGAADGSDEMQEEILGHGIEHEELIEGIRNVQEKEPADEEMQDMVKEPETEMGAEEQEHIEQPGVQGDEPEDPSILPPPPRRSSRLPIRTLIAPKKPKRKGKGKAVKDTPRRSTRVSGRRKFADEPFTTPTKK
ncbi:hypothetical protein AUEXF2481DRAFT_7059 [Aureobasidium subglaciale EXF-2481]|uniref:Uncharacterized protein n=1 Tax=Aureobasidium subglaciale (strain EXF-2481) TaxID=1043005 RepID=A0A074Y5T6_AURSE|nr:uncharacterized protein AUEXF2481DRAFT_7059 [Aureobasidium subglaciale EXF-2481]KAI5206867.1 hypothetical protein E4T38_03606 [Aureobasidium subglaciale]KAI5225598.1 hypothetical protein E4T40_03381 [Aureobasidium subglaciale]KAI5229077.1 hypothetical protein E4T41_03554 [Aureobasidium subglaciale]KAI5263864.1 hypothetical protein E4T46_03380 [Aureobasidium subglaciale]KEQ93108.1 hypothetical protein AUEXF2481DRAFT_7059 [Aureobasidium subglaciale EXF-2481]